MNLNETKAALTVVLALAQAQVEHLENTAPKAGELNAQKYALSIVEQHLAELDVDAEGLTHLVKCSRHALNQQLPFSAEESLALDQKRQALDSEIRLVKVCVNIVGRMLAEYGALVTDDQEINGGDLVGDLVEWVLNAQAVFKKPLVNPAIQIFQGFIKLGSEFHQVSFDAPVNATIGEKDLAMMAALAQVAEIDYVSIGEDENNVLHGATAFHQGT